jgi:molybdopterin adenylyltransferase
MIRVAVLTVSDSAAEGTREDLSGPALVTRCRDLGWTVVDHKTVPDEEQSISEILRCWTEDSSASLVLTTGGTGVAPRDVTPEATRAVIDREIPGLAELLRIRGLDQTAYAVLSRGIVGSRKRSLIVNLPGSPKGAVYSFGILEPLLPHIVDLLNGRTAHKEIADARLPSVAETRGTTGASHQ